MAFLFGRAKARNDLARSARESLQRLLEVNPDSKVGFGSPVNAADLMLTSTKIEEDLAKVLSQIKLVLQGTQGTH